MSKRICTESDEACTIECKGAEDNGSMLTTSCSHALVDLGIIVKDAQGSFQKLRHMASSILDSKLFQYLTSHFRPSAAESLQSHPVTKQGKSHSSCVGSPNFLGFAIARSLKEACVAFPEPPSRRMGGSQGTIPGVLVLSSYQTPFTKALGKDGILVHHEQTVMHQYAAERADCFKVTHITPDVRVDSLLTKNNKKKTDRFCARLFIVSSF